MGVRLSPAAEKGEKELKEGLRPSEIDHLLSKIKPHPVVALVDDDPATLDLLERALKDEGYEIHHFQRAEDFLERFSEVRPDTIVMEVVLPGISGLSVLDELRPKDLEGSVPTLVLSKRDDIHAKLLAFRKGASDYVTKPFEAEEVAVRVRALVRTKIIQEMLEKFSISDPLTALYNRRFLLNWLEREIERTKRYGLELACILVDLDHFREINQEKGEPFGDFLLREFGGVIARNCRRSDIVGRIQNDEFLLLLPAANKEQAMTVACRLKRMVAGHSFEWKGKKLSPTFCIGITSCRASEAADPDLFLGKAKEALEKAKSVGLAQTAVLGIV